MPNIWQSQFKTGYLQNTRCVLQDYLVKSHSLSEIERLFLAAGFVPTNSSTRNKCDLIDQFYSQIKWSQKNSASVLFKLATTVLADLKYKCSCNVEGGQLLREHFINILNSIRKDGADFSSTVKWVRNDQKTIKLQPAESNSKSSGTISNAVDILFITALTEEHQIVTAILNKVSMLTEERKTGLQLYKYQTKNGTHYNIAAASAYQKGAVAMGIFASPLFREYKPTKAVLFGISATVKPTEVSIGDVPCASQVVSLDDIAVQKGLEFRTDGYQTDPIVRRWIGYLQTSQTRYYAWQAHCKEIINHIVKVVNTLRRKKISIPEDFDLPHILVGNVAGGPLLIRDADFRKALTQRMPKYSNRRVTINNPVHPTLLSAEMESHGFMKAALEENIQASVIKGISDDGSSNKARLEKITGGFYRAYACSNAVLTFLHSLEINSLNDHRYGDSK